MLCAGCKAERMSAALRGRRGVACPAATSVQQRWDVGSEGTWPTLPKQEPASLRRRHLAAGELRLARGAGTRCREVELN